MLFSEVLSTCTTDLARLVTTNCNERSGGLPDVCFAIMSNRIGGCELNALRSERNISTVEECMKQRNLAGKREALTMNVFSGRRTLYKVIDCHKIQRPSQHYCLC